MSCLRASLRLRYGLADAANISSLSFSPVARSMATEPGPMASLQAIESWKYDSKTQASQATKQPTQFNVPSPSKALCTRGKRVTLSPEEKSTLRLFVVPRTL